MMLMVVIVVVRHDRQFCSALKREHGVTGLIGGSVTVSLLDPAFACKCSNQKRMMESFVARRRLPPRPASTAIWVVLPRPELALAVASGWVMEPPRLTAARRFGRPVCLAGGSRPEIHREANPLAASTFLPH
jgi:hypothetical protein